MAVAAILVGAAGAVAATTIVLFGGIVATWFTAFSRSSSTMDRRAHSSAVDHPAFRPRPGTRHPHPSSSPPPTLDGRSLSWATSAWN
jgi:hypothetical protein